MEKSNTFEKTMDLAGNAIKLAANLSEPKKDIPNHITKPYKQVDDNSNKASTGTQSVNVLVGNDKDKKSEPPIEKHIHTYPENRPLTTEECELDLKKAQMDYELMKSRQTYFQKSCDRAWAHDLEMEKKNERRNKIRRIFGGILIALGVGGVGYSIYTDYRNSKNSGSAAQRVQVPVQGSGEPVKTDGEVK